MTNLFQANQQWATRPADQRFTSLPAMYDFMKNVRQHSNGKVVSSRALKAIPASELPGGNQRDLKGLMLVGPNGHPVTPTHWSFNQLAQRAGVVNATDLRKLPAPLAADCLNYGLQHYRNVEDVGVLLHKDGALTPELRAVTGPNYGRVWNMHVVDALMSRFGDGITGDFRVPGEFGKRIEVTNDNTTLYASDRDMFVFLADETHRIEMPGRRPGLTGSLARGFFVWNSEVGKCKLGVATFLFDYVCCNRIVWGAEGYSEISIRHSASAPDRFVEEVTPALKAYANSSTLPITKALEDARAKKIGNPDEVLEFLSKRFSRTQSQAIMAAHVSEENRPVETLWDCATGITAYARGIQYQDDRVELEREAGKILALAA